MLCANVPTCALGFGTGSGRLARRVIPASARCLRTSSECGTGAQRPFVAEPVLLLPLSERHLWVALRYVEANAVRAGLVAQAAAYRWSSAAAHLGEGCDPAGVLDGGYWERSGGSATWKELHEAGEPEDQVHLLRRCTYAGRPFGDEEFVVRMEEHFQRHWRRWSFEKAASSARI